MSKSEKIIEKKLKEWTESAGGKCIKIATIHEAGLPDRLCIFPFGTYVFVETKSAGKKPSKIQNYQHRKLIKLGCHVHVPDNLADVMNIIARYAD